MKSLMTYCLPLTMLFLGSAATILFAEPPPDNPRVRAVAAITELSEHVKDRDVAERAKKIVDEHDSCNISNFFRLKRVGGFGIGKLAKADNQNSVESLVLQLTRRKDMTEQELDEKQADYVRVAKGLQAMAALAPFRGPEFTRNVEMREKAWADVSVEFKKVTADFRRAIEERDPKKLRLEATRLNQTCNNCHVLRDS